MVQIDSRFFLPYSGWDGGLMKRIGVISTAVLSGKICLFGSRRRFDLGTDRLGSDDMRVARKKYRLFAQDYLISPVKLDDITDFCRTQFPANTVPASAKGPHANDCC